MLLALALAGTFAFLGRWQLQRSIENGKPGPATTETQHRLQDITHPQQPMPSKLDGQRVSARGHFVPGDTVVLTGRSGGGTYQTVGRFVLDANGASLPVVIGYADSREKALAGGERAAKGTTITVVGRYYPSESPDQDAFEKGQFSAVSSAFLPNEWKGFSGEIYGGYVVATAPTAELAGLGTIADHKPVRTVQLDWLNLFYAVEWVVFAGFAVFLWWRFVRDAYEREQDELAEGAGSGRDGGGAADGDGGGGAAGGGAADGGAAAEEPTLHVSEGGAPAGRR
ncbi:SURF1 family protein [Curtobacterium ammoniigenes]|uniref:SURF1 family protein n=1 Tax=Curtobacterium ammoniigenes TaxID=395387 RepID=UPI001470467A|nr:SURF1 family protein [Curtobacterium ammoniigenes]